MCYNIRVQRSELTRYLGRIYLAQTREVKRSIEAVTNMLLRG